MNIDVIMPFHKVDGHLWAAITSVLDSEGVKVRLVLMDDRDVTEAPLELPDYIENRKATIEVYRTRKHGYYNALNDSRKHIQSNWIALMNSDDLISKVRFFEQIQELIRTNSDLCICGICKFTKHGRVPSLAGEPRSAHYDYKFLLLGPYGADATWVIRREKFEEFIFPDIALGGDWYLAMDVFSSLRITSIDSDLYFYRMHENQATSKSTTNNSDNHAIYQKWLELNARLGLPQVSMSVFVRIAMPWIASKASRREVCEMKIWMGEYRKLFGDNNLKQAIEDILKRRLAITEFHSKRISLRLLPTKVKLLYLLVFSHLKKSAPRIQQYNPTMDTYEHKDN